MIHLGNIQSLREGQRDLETNPAWVCKNIIIPWLEDLGYPTSINPEKGCGLNPVNRVGTSPNTHQLVHSWNTEIEIIIVPEYLEPDIDQQQFSQFENSPAALLAITNGTKIQFYAQGDRTLHGKAAAEFEIENSSKCWDFLKAETYDRNQVSEALHLTPEEKSLFLQNNPQKGTQAPTEQLNNPDPIQPTNIVEAISITLESFLTGTNPELIDFVKAKHPEATDEDVAAALIHLRDKIVTRTFTAALEQIPGFLPQMGNPGPSIFQQERSYCPPEASPLDPPQQELPVVPEIVDENQIALQTIRQFFHGVYDPERINLRFNQSYVAVLLDDNNRKTLCRLYLRGARPTIAFLDSDKKEARQILSGPLPESLKEHRKTILQSAEKFGVIFPPGKGPDAPETPVSSDTQEPGEISSEEE
jgi:hypothetical protein